MSNEAADNYEKEKDEDPRMDAVGNTEPAESSEVDPGTPEKKGAAAEAPEGADKEMYPGPAGDPQKIEEGEEEAK